ncbi:MAG TPA: metallophosphoesterase [Polyangia bacterium]|jgi:predicted phosphodiesterase
MPARALLLLAVVAATPAPTTPAPPPPATSAPARAADAGADKALAVRLEPFRFFAGAPPAGWSDPAFDDRSWSGPAPGPFVPRQPPLPQNVQQPAGATNFDLVPGQPLLLRARFAVPDARRVRVLELRVAYNDAFVAYVNGREVARRGMAPGGAAAAVPHGPEVERVYVAVPDVLPALSPDGNLLAIAIHSYPERSTVIPTAPAAMVGLAAASGVRIVRGPYLAAPAESGNRARVNIAWETDLPSRGRVVVEPAPGGAATPPPMQIRTGPAATRQLVAVDTLARGARYDYRVEVEAGPGDGAASAPARFETLPAPPAPLRFAVYGDMRYSGHEAHRTIVDALVREAPPLVFNTGDMTDEGSQEANWQRYFDITAPLGAIAPVIPVLGNHDAARAGAGAAKTWALFAMPTPAPPFWTSLDLGGVHFVVLDTNDAANAAQRAWLADDLARARRHHARGVFAFCHEPPWSHGLHGNSHRMIRDYAPLLAAGHVDVFFCGHDHIYERGVGPTKRGKLVYVVTGGGGAPLYNPRCEVKSVGPSQGPTNKDVPGPLPPCPPTVAALAKSYHYITVSVDDDAITLCPKRPDGSAVEPCVRLPPHRR